MSLEHRLTYFVDSGQVCMSFFLSNQERLPAQKVSFLVCATCCVFSLTDVLFVAFSLTDVLFIVFTD